MRTAVVVGLAVVVAGVGVWLASSSDERQVRARIHEMAEAVSAPAAETDLARLTRLAVLRRGLAPDIVVGTRDGTAEIVGRDAVMGLAAQATQRTGPLSVGVRGMDVTVEGERAVALATVTVAGLSAQGQRTEDEVQELRLELVPVDGEWLVSRVEALAALQR